MNCNLNYKNMNSKLVLYNYDAFLFDFNPEDGLEFLNIVKQTIESDGKYPVKISKGCKLSRYARHNGEI